MSCTCVEYKYKGEGVVRGSPTPISSVLKAFALKTGSFDNFFNDSLLPLFP